MVPTFQIHGTFQMHKWFFRAFKKKKRVSNGTQMVLLYGIDAKTLFLSVFDAECICFMYSPHAISKIFSFPGLVLTTAGFILAGVSQTEWSLSRDLSITGCARPHSAANQIGSVLPVLAMGVSWAFSPFRRPMCHYQLPLSSSNVFCRGVVLFS